MPPSVEPVETYFFDFLLFFDCFLFFDWDFDGDFGLGLAFDLEDELFADVFLPPRPVRELIALPAFSAASLASLRALRASFSSWSMRLFRRSIISCETDSAVSRAIRSTSCTA